MIVKLLRHEVKFCIFIGAEVCRVNRQNGVFDARKTATTGIEAEGFIGEYGYGKIHGLIPDFSVIPRSGGSDFSREDSEIDCKMSKHPNLMVVGSKGDRWDRSVALEYAAMQGCSKVLEEDGSCFLIYRGWIPAEQLFRPCNLRTNSVGSHYFVAYKDLMPGRKPLGGMVSRQKFLIETGQLILPGSQDYESVYQSLTKRLKEVG